MNLSHLQNIKLVIFDFDGTIADTSEGILDSHKFALKTLGLKIPSDEFLRSLIGKNLLTVYVSIFHLEEKKAIEAVAIYRQRYAEFGIHKAVLYPKFTEMLRTLKARGIKIGIATLKLEKFAIEILQELAIKQYFNVVCGMNAGDNLNKAGLILKCVKLCECSIRETVMVGDSENDVNGAMEAGVNFIGATYGFGFKPNLKHNFITVNNPEEILSKL